MQVRIIFNDNRSEEGLITTRFLPSQVKGKKKIVFLKISYFEVKARKC